MTTFPALHSEKGAEHAFLKRKPSSRLSLPITKIYAYSQVSYLAANSLMLAQMYSICSTARELEEGR